MTAAQPKLTPAIDSRQSLVFGIYDRLYDHGHCVADVVLAPAKADGEPDWENAGPANVSRLPADEWPEDAIAEKRACIIVDHVDGCGPETCLLLWLDDADEPNMARIAGPEPDGDIAMRIIGRDIGATPPERTISPLSESLLKLAESFSPPPAPANDNKPEAALNTFPVVNPAHWHGQPIPARQWFIPDLIPMRQVTLLSGDGGVGKSLFALQLAAAASMSVETLDLEPWAGRTLYIGAEDEAEEFQRRLDDIAHAHGRQLDELLLMRLIPLADRDALLAVPDKAGNMQPTSLWRGIANYAADYKPRLIVLDTSADLFGGDEIKRGQVRQFIAMLRKLAIDIDCAIVLLSHPSVQGMQTGTGISGSTGWNNSVRSRLYLTKEKDEDSDVRILKVMKANYGTTGAEIRLRWKAGAFVLDDGATPAGAALVERKHESTFMDVLERFTGVGQKLSPSPSATYAPKMIAEHPAGKGSNKRDLAAAMQRLLEMGKIRIDEFGPHSRKTRFIVACE